MIKKFPTLLRFSFCSSKSRTTRQEIFEKLRSKQELDNYQNEVSNYEERGGIMMKYLHYRKYELLGLLLASLGAYFAYKVYTVGGIVVNPLTGKKNLTCLNPETEVQVANKIEKVFRLETAINNQPPTTIITSSLSRVLHDLKTTLNETVEPVLIDNKNNIILLLPNNKLVISKTVLVNYQPDQLRDMILLSYASLKLHHTTKNLHYSEILDVMGFLFFKAPGLSSSIKMREMYANKLTKEEYEECRTYLREKHQLETSLEGGQIRQGIDGKASRLSIEYKFQNCT